MTLNELRRLRDAVQPTGLPWERAPDFYTAPGLRTVDQRYYLERPGGFLLFDADHGRYAVVAPWEHGSWSQTIGARVVDTLQTANLATWTPWPHARRSSGTAWSRKSL